MYAEIFCSEAEKNALVKIVMYFMYVLTRPLSDMLMVSADFISYDWLAHETSERGQVVESLK